MNESDKRLPRGIRNNNPLNIEKGNNWMGERHPQMDTRFEEFKSVQYGLRAGFKLIKNYLNEGGRFARTDNTIYKIINRFAPSAENNTLAYINTVCAATGINAHEVIRFSDRRKIVAIVRAMAFVECGAWIDPAICESAYDMV